MEKRNHIRNKAYNPGLFWEKVVNGQATGYENRTGFILGIDDESTKLADNLRTGKINFQKYTLNYAAAAAKGFKDLSNDKDKLEAQHNCDLVAIAEYTKGCVLAVIDGVGNLPSTKIHCENLANAIIDPKFDFEAKTDTDFEGYQIEADTCACISTIQISDELELKETHAGDTKTMVLRYDDVKKNYNITEICDIDNIAALQFQNGTIDHDQYINHRQRNYITNGIAVNDIDNDQISYENRPTYLGLSTPLSLQLQPNDIVLMFSDGIDDNFTHEEILDIVNQYQAQGPEAILRAISEAQYKRVTFKSTKKKPNDGYKKPAKPDNLSAICLRIEGKAVE